MEGHKENWFQGMVVESVLVQSLVTLFLISTICYMAIANMNIPSVVIEMTLLVVGYWFGAKNNVTMNRAIEKVADRIHEHSA